MCIQRHDILIGIHLLLFQLTCLLLTVGRRLLIDDKLHFQSGETAKPVYSTTYTRTPTKNEAEQMQVSGSILIICIPY